ncbi:MAG: hypothetical protein EZS28_023110 [Streblomastix strix]|uniref:Uncharacterized protein n=1 Tax=Streblomastix strix TaxID=222440 RepID=A0A5J4VFV5_9EUKA|nr:MAG: hypothetical protein EZS28_023110 [Streblomastix strix]
MSICFFRPNEIAEIRLKFSNVNKTENQASLRLSPKQVNVIETYEVFETDNEKLCSKLAIYEWIDRLKKQFPKGTDFLLWHKGAEDSMSISILNTTLSNNRTCKARVNGIASQLTSNPGLDNERLNQISQQRGEIRREGNNQLLSSSPIETGNKERILQRTEGSNKRNDAEGGLERMEWQCRDKYITLSKFDKFDNELSIKRGCQRVVSTNTKKKQANE